MSEPHPLPNRRLQMRCTRTRTSYYATAFNPSEGSYQPALGYDDPDASTWQHLRPRESTRNSAPPPLAQSPQVHTGRRDPVQDDTDAIERQFRIHQQQRKPNIRRFGSPDLRVGTESQAGTSSHNPNIQDFDSNAQPPQNASRKCARCLQPGHSARECSGPTRATCGYCGQVGHLNLECPKSPRANPGPHQSPAVERANDDKPAYGPHAARTAGP